MIWTGLELHGDPVHRRDHPLDDPRLGRPPDVEEPRHGVDPLDLIAKYGADATRYGLLKMSSIQDVRFTEGALEEGRKLANKLWNVSRLLLQHRVEPEAAARARGTVDPRALDATRAELGADWGAFDFSHLCRRSTGSRSTTSATGTPRRSSRASAGDEDAAATALAALERLLRSCTRDAARIEEIWSQFHPDEASAVCIATPA